MIKKKKRFFYAFNEFGENTSESPILKAREKKIWESIFERARKLREQLRARGVIVREPKEEKSNESQKNHSD
jgi:hypothetical protein